MSASLTVLLISQSITATGSMVPGSRPHLVPSTFDLFSPSAVTPAALTLAVSTAFQTSVTIAFMAGRLRAAANYVLQNRRKKNRGAQKEDA